MYNDLGKIEDAGQLVDGGRIDRYWEGGNIQLDIPFYTGTNEKLNHKWLYSSDEALQHFGLRSIEFGNWMNQEDRANFLYASMLGLCQLSEIFKVPAKAIGLGGKLSIALGARGHGKAAGHYESTPYSVINITKTQGIGVLAHEYGHALDNVISFHTKSQQKFVSGGRTTRKGYDSIIVKNGNYFEQQFEEFFSALYYEDEDNKTEFHESIAELPEYWQRRNEVFARTFEVYVSEQQKEHNLPNHFLAPVAFGKEYPNIELVEEVSHFIEDIAQKGFQILQTNKVVLNGINPVVTGYKGLRTTINEHADVDDTIAAMQDVIYNNYEQVSELAQVLKKDTVAETAEEIWDFVRQNIKYKLDTAGKEELRTPARTWHDKTLGADCDDYTIFICSLLLSLGIQTEFRVVAYKAKGRFQHVYPVAIDEQGEDWVIDCVPEIPHFNYEEQPIIDIKRIPMELQELSGTLEAVDTDVSQEEEILEELEDDLNEPFTLEGVDENEEDELEDEEEDIDFLSGFKEVDSEEEADLVLSGADIPNIVEKGLLAEVHKAKKSLQEEVENPTMISKLVPVKAELARMTKLIANWDEDVERNKILAQGINSKSSYSNFYKALLLSFSKINEASEELSGMDDTEIFLAKMDMNEILDEDESDLEGVDDDFTEMEDESSEEDIEAEEADDEELEGVDDDTELEQDDIQLQLLAGAELGFLKRFRRRIAQRFKRGRLKKFFHKVGRGFKKVVKAVVRYNPATILIRNAILLILKLNLFHFAERLIYGYLSFHQARARKLDINEWKRFVALRQRAERFFTKFGGRAVNFRNAIVRGRARIRTRLPLRGIDGLGAAASTAVATASPFVIFMKKALHTVNPKRLFSKARAAIRHKIKNRGRIIRKAKNLATRNIVRHFQRKPTRRPVPIRRPRPQVLIRQPNRPVVRRTPVRRRPIRTFINRHLPKVFRPRPRPVRQPQVRPVQPFIPNNMSTTSKPSFFQKLKAWVQKHKKPIIISSIGAVVVIVGIIIYKKKNKKPKAKRSLAGTRRRRATRRAPRTLKGSTTVLRIPSASVRKTRVSKRSNTNRLKAMHKVAKQLQAKSPRTKYSTLLKRAAKMI